MLFYVKMLYNWQRTFTLLCNGQLENIVFFFPFTFYILICLIRSFLAENSIIIATIIFYLLIYLSIIPLFTPRNKINDTVQTTDLVVSLKQFHTTSEQSIATTMYKRCLRCRRRTRNLNYIPYMLKSTEVCKSTQVITDHIFI